MRDERLKTICKRALLLGLLAAILLVAVLRNTPCIFRCLTGIPCPGCGMSRAWLAAFRLDLAMAFRSHPMFWGIPLLGCLYILDGCPFPRKRTTKVLYLLILAGFLLTYGVRMILYFRGISAI